MSFLFLEDPRFTDKSGSPNEDDPDRLTRHTEQREAKLRMLSYLPEKIDGPILEIGPGGGWSALQLSRRSPDVTMITNSPADLEKIEADPLVKHLPVLIMDMHRMAFADDRFALVHMSHVLEHSCAPYVVLAECFRVLRPRGLLQIIMPPAEGYVGLHKPRPTRLGAFSYHYFCGSFQTVVELLRHVGFFFDAYHEIPAWSAKMIQYWNRIWMAHKPPPEGEPWLTHQP